VFVTSEDHPGARFQRALAAGNLTAAEGGVRTAVHPAGRRRALVELYVEKGDRKFERAALKYVGRYITEANPSLADSRTWPRCSPNGVWSCEGSRPHASGRSRDSALVTRNG
jgi:hypothetical protein